MDRPTPRLYGTVEARSLHPFSPRAVSLLAAAAVLVAAAVLLALRRRRESPVAWGSEGTRHLLQTSKNTTGGAPSGARAFLDGNPGWVHVWMNDHEAGAFIEKEFPRVYAVAWSRLDGRLGAMKGDIWRYCALSHFGGVYMDDKAEFPEDEREGWKDVTKARLYYEDTTEREICAEVAGANTHLRLASPAPKVRNWCMQSPARSPFFLRAVARLCDDCERYVEVSASMKERVLALTGPWLLTRTIQDNPDASDFVCTQETWSHWALLYAHAKVHGNPDYSLLSSEEPVFPVPDRGGT
jgi:hypothetical protein